MSRYAEEAQEPEASATSTRRPAFWAATFASLSERDYAWYFTGNLAFFMAMQMQFILRGFLAFDLTGAASALGLVSVSISLPMLLAAPLGGVIADRVNKRTLLIVTQSVAAIASAIVAVLIIAEWIEFWHLLAVSLVTGTVFAFNMPARQALVPLLVPQHKLMNAISLQMGGVNLTRIVAPALGGLLIAPLGLGWVYLLTALLFLIATASEFALPTHGLTGMTKTGRFFDEFSQGVSYVLENRTIGFLILAGMLVPLFGFPVQQILPVFAKEVFDRGPSGLGMLAAVSGIGGLFGAVVSANMDRQASKGRLLLIGGLVMGAFLVGFALAPFFGMALLFIAMASAGQMLFMATNNTVIQASVPGELRGRVMSLMLMSFGAMPLGVLPITFAADAAGAPATIAVSSSLLIVLVVLLFGLFKPLRDLRMEALSRSELSPAQGAAMVADGRLTREEADQLVGTSRQAAPPSL